MIKWDKSVPAPLVMLFEQVEFTAVACKFCKEKRCSKCGVQIRLVEFYKQIIKESDKLFKK